MKRSPKRSTVTIALALIAALAIASPVFGVSTSLKKAIRKEVARQISKATGPAGSAGTNGVNGNNGTNGTDGTARAYATVNPSCLGISPFTCGVSEAKGVTDVSRPGSPGSYCVTAPGIDGSSVPAAVTVDWSTTGAPEGNASAMIVSPGCGVGAVTGFEVVTQRIPTTGSDSAAPANDVGFTIVIP